MSLLYILSAQPLFAAAAQAEARAEVVSPAAVCGSFEDECAKFGVKMSATSPEVIVSPNVVARFDIIGARDKGCSIVFPPTVDVHNREGHTIGVCSLASIMGSSRSDSDVVGVVITAQTGSSLPRSEPCRAEFDVIVAYD
jgi:hypothetical protein